MPRSIMTALRVAALAAAGIVSLAFGLYTSWAHAPHTSLPFTLSKNSVLRASPLKIGDLSIVPEPEAEALLASNPMTRTAVDRCVHTGHDWLARSADGGGLTLKSPFVSPGDRVSTAVCNDTGVLVGGCEQRDVDGVTQSRSWIFHAPAAHSDPWGPSKVVFSRSFTVGTPPHQMPFTLHDVMAIDPAAAKIVFSGEAADGTDAVLVAPFAMTTSNEATETAHN
jgi:hypothetical protein